MSVPASTYPAASVPAARAAQPARILVVDDELGVSEGCRKILAAEGYEAVTAGDGKAGLEQFLERGTLCRTPGGPADAADVGSGADA